MRTETLHEVLHAAPFRPFTLCLADGTRVDVPHPDFIAHPPGARIAVVMGRDESTHYIDLALVTKIDVGPPSPAGRSQKTPTAGIDGRASLARIRTDRWSPLPCHGG